MLAEREVRVFVSSTFQDMKEEREELAKRVFPELRKLCEGRGVAWGEVDLRWGITDEEKAEGKVLPTCLAEIRNCRPYFIGILGERYGWVSQGIPPRVLEQEPWLANHGDRSVTELEILHGVLNDPAMAEHAFFYFRSSAASPTSDESPERHARLEDLKTRIRDSRLPLRENYPTPAAFGKLVLDDLTRVIEGRFPQGSEPDPLDREGAAQETFARTRRSGYVGGRASFERLDRHVTERGLPLVVTGPAGNGKSALLAAWAADYQARNPHALVLTHFIGASAESTDWIGTIRRLLGELSRRRDLGLGIPDAPDQLRAAFAAGLEAAGSRGPLVLVLDALNQLEDREGALELEWIPRQISASVRLIVSTLPGRPLEALTRRNWPRLEVEPLELEERKDLIVSYLEQYRKRLPADQVERIAGTPAAANPLYLRVLLEELRLWGEHATLAAQTAHYLGAADPGQLYQKVFERCERDYDRDRPGLVRDALILLWAARRGLSPRELLDLLGTSAGPLPGAHWSPLYLALEGSLLSRSGLLGFSHEHARAAVEARYLRSDDARREARVRVAEYFQDQPIGPRMADELPWQVAELGEWPYLQDFLTNEATLAALWSTGPGKLDARRYWARLEAAGHSMEAAYRAILDRPAEHPWTAYTVRELLAGSGRVEPALKLDEALLGFYRGPEFAERTRQAAEQARERQDQESVDLYADAQPRMAADRLEQMAHGHLQQGEFERALELLAETEPTWRRLRDQRSLGRCLELQGDVCLAAGDLRLAERRYQEAEAAVTAAGGAPLDDVRLSRSRVLQARGKLREALELTELVERERRGRGDQVGLATVLSDQGLLLSELKQHARALEKLEEAAQTDRELGDERALANTLNIIATVHWSTRQRQRAIEVLAEAERIARRTGDRRTLAACLYNQAQLLSRAKGLKARALEQITEAARLFTELGDAPRALHARGLRAQIQAGYRQPWKGWVVLLLLGALAAFLVKAGFGRWWWWLLGIPLALLWLHTAGVMLIPGYRRMMERSAKQLGAELRKMD